MASTSAASRTVANLARFAVAFALVVIVFGAFVRLSNAGLSCPDWPLCYGRITWPEQAHEIAQANQAFPERPVETDKAWREQVHRFVAGGLILVTLAIAVVAFRRRREPGVPWRSAIFVLVLILFQALLGMWTVTWKLKPIVVMAHLLGGMATLCLLTWIAARAGGRGGETALRRGGVIAALVLVAIQIALGGWVSANYAALACGTDFPQCLGFWWPQADFREGFVLWRGIGVDYEGGVLDAPARTAIHLAHRVFAILVAGHLIALGVRALRIERWRLFGGGLLVLLATQIALGIANVKLGLPLPVATAHNGVAALLLAWLVLALARTTPRRDANAWPGAWAANR